VDGSDVHSIFANEAGGHRFQRVPENEKHGRVQTSTVTVAVLEEPAAAQVHLEDRDLILKACRGSGAGGQARNKTSNAIQITHVPTGTQVRVESERSQHRNREMALALLRARLWEAQESKASGERSELRRAQLGLGQRGDKRRTIRFKDEQVNDHVTGKRWRLRDYLRGDWN
jgi:peptide chain release factor 1